MVTLENCYNEAIAYINRKYKHGFHADYLSDEDKHIARLVGQYFSSFSIREELYNALKRQMIVATIKDEKGKKLAVTDLKAALKQATEACQWHKFRTELKNCGADVILFPDAYEHWKHVKAELEKLIK